MSPRTDHEMSALFPNLVKTLPMTSNSTSNERTDVITDVAPAPDPMSSHETECVQCRMNQQEQGWAPCRECVAKKVFYDMTKNIQAGLHAQDDPLEVTLLFLKAFEDAFPDPVYDA